MLDLRGALAEAGVRQAHGLDQRTPQAEASEGVQGEHTQGRAGEAEKALDWRLIKNPLRAAGGPSYVQVFTDDVEDVVCAPRA